jgi:heme A synthase
MTPTAAFRTASRLGRATTVLMFLLIVIGSVVRTTGSGLACPDWPLCHGRLIPPMEPHVLIEWVHRLVALLVSVMLAATAGFVLFVRETRARLGGLAIAVVVLLAAQIVLGGLTVLKLLSPAIVSAHLGTALLLFSALLTLTLSAHEAAGEGAASAPPTRPAGLLPRVGGITVLAYLQALLGGVVSSSGAGLACTEWPLCNGAFILPLDRPEGIHMLHRGVGYALALAVLVAALDGRTAQAPRVRHILAGAVGLVLFQIALGVANIMLALPPWLVALHLANAAAILATLLTATFRLARMASPARSLAAVAA